MGRASAQLDEGPPLSEYCLKKKIKLIYVILASTAFRVRFEHLSRSQRYI